MKTKKFEKKLVLNKKTVSDLNPTQMSDAQGGISGLPTCAACTQPHTCQTLCCPLQETSGCNPSGGGFYSCEGTCNSICMVSACALTECC
jgi:hypothetical protein